MEKLDLNKAIIYAKKYRLKNVLDMVENEFQQINDENGQHLTETKINLMNNILKLIKEYKNEKSN